MSDTSAEPITAVVRQVLSARGPMSQDDLLAALIRDGVDLGPAPEGMLSAVLDQEGELFMPLADGRWAWIPTLLDGRIFTHRLSAAEAAHDIIGLGPDLAPLAMLTELDTYQRLSDGSPITEVSPFLDSEVLAAREVPTTAFDSDAALLLAAGRFAALGVGAGDLVGYLMTIPTLSNSSLPSHVDSLRRHCTTPRASH